MARNWLEELVAEFYRLKGYLVITDLDLPMPSTSSRSVRGHSDIDVLAIKSKEMIHVECKNYWTSNTEDGIEKLKEQFEISEPMIIKNFPFLNGIHNFRKVLVTNGKPRKLEQMCQKHGIILKDISVDILDPVIAHLKKEMKDQPGLIGKRESFVTRLLIHMIEDGEYLQES